MVLDAVRAQDVKVVPCTESMLFSPLAQALAHPEPDWEAPRPSGWEYRGGSWGSQRTILFSGLK